MLLSLTACGSKARAETIADGPPLAVPTPPAHEIAIEQVVEAPQSELPPAQEPAPATAPKPTVTRIGPAKPEPREAPAPAATQPPPTPPAAEPPVRAAPPATAGDERKVKDLLTRANTDRNRVDYQRLSTEGKAQYDQSKRFADEAQQAVKERNFVYALTLAEKAATLAAELVR